MNATEASDDDGVVPLSDIAKLTAIVVYSSLSALAIVGNASICLIIVHFRRLHSPTNYLLANLCIGDILLGCAMPFSYWPMLIAPRQRWPFGAALCKTLPFIQGVAVLSVSWTLVAISFDRFFAIVFVLSPWLRVTRRRARALIAVTWTCSAAMSTPFAVVNQLEENEAGEPICLESGWRSISFISNANYSTLLFVLQYCVPLCVLVVTYACILLRVWTSRLPDGGDRRSSNDPRDSVRKMIPMMILVSCLYAACWAPQNILMNILVPIEPQLGSYKYILYVWWWSNTIAMAHSIINPIIYYRRNEKFREGFKHLLRCFRFNEFELLHQQTTMTMMTERTRSLQHHQQKVYSTAEQ